MGKKDMAMICCAKCHKSKYGRTMNWILYNTRWFMIEGRLFCADCVFDKYGMKTDPEPESEKDKQWIRKDYPSIFHIPKPKD